MDAKKKKKLFKIPLNFQVASLAEKVLKGRTEGYVLRSRSNRNKDGLVTPIAIWYVWRKWATEARLFNWKEFSPLVGRRFFAAEWYHRQRLDLIGLSMIMRHSEPRITLGYVEKLFFYEDLKRQYKQFQFNFLQEDVNVPRGIEDLKQMIDDVFASLVDQLQTLEQTQFNVRERKLESRKVAATVGR